jgi:AcrR family transcriptional regulator
VASPTRRPLSRDRVLRAALALADRDGLESCAMRRVAKELGVEAMSLYNHVASKSDMIDGLVDLVFAEIELPAAGDGDWRAAMRRRAMSTRAALQRHPWAVGLMEGRMAPGPASLRSHEAMLGCLREAGFGLRDAIHASSVLDAYVHGFALQEKALPFDRPEEVAGVMATQQRDAPDMAAYPRLREVAAGMAEAGYDFAEEFAFGLDLILDGLERHRSGRR